MLPDFVKNEPVMVQAVVQVIVAAVAHFGFNLSAEQISALAAFVALVLALFARGMVTPNSKVPPAPQEFKP